jgi:XTP/dITP diphosphohydrolase
LRLPSKKLLVATRNRGKLQEIREVMGDLPLAVVGFEEVGADSPEVEETGETYAENALLKARAALAATGLAALADDSGIEVDALGGAPGVLSARFAGPRATDEDNNRLLLARLAGVPAAQRTARFVCTAALVLPAADPILTRGVVEGRIVEAPRGGRGFGYDPLFYYEPLGLTFGEADAAAKNRASHRGQAFRAMAECVRALLSDQES